MQTIPPLADLGRRIMILGPSNAGKSTLADAIARKLGIEAIHLDVFCHQPGTDWVPRDKAEFRALHDAAIAEDSWVMDGNYTDIMPQRFARASGVIVIDDHYLKRYVRYFRRTLFQKQRLGALPGSRDSVKWSMINWIWKSRNASKYRRMTAETGLPSAVCHSLNDVNALYAAWQLSKRR